MQAITKDLYHVGVNDYDIDLFESQYHVPHGMAYNSYVIMDEKIAVIDTVEVSFGDLWFEKLEEVLQGRTPDYLVVQHMEPDHAGSISRFMERYPDARIVGNAKTFTMIGNYYGVSYADRKVVVKNRETLPLGAHTLSFLFAPMVHWPEVMVTYDSADRVLFSADAFGKFGATDAEEPWDDEARRYYIGIVGKYGAQTQALLKNAKTLEIETICSAHGPVLTGDLSHYLDLYQKWSSYEPEEKGTVIACASVYGHTMEAAQLLKERLEAAGETVRLFDLNRCDMAGAVSEAFHYDKLVLASVTYNAEIFPSMKDYIAHLVERNFQKRTVAYIENGSWAPVAAKVMRTALSGCKNLTEIEEQVTVRSALSEDSRGQIDRLAEALLG